MRQCLEDQYLHSKKANGGYGHHPPRREAVLSPLRRRSRSATMELYCLTPEVYNEFIGRTRETEDQSLAKRTYRSWSFVQRSRGRRVVDTSQETVTVTSHYSSERQTESDMTEQMDSGKKLGWRRPWPSAFLHHTPRPCWHHQTY